MINFLESRGVTYTGLQYGNYTPKEFNESLGQVKYCIIIDNTESQGIAIQEMMDPWQQTIICLGHYGMDLCPRISSTSNICSILV